MSIMSTKLYTEKWGYFGIIPTRRSVPVTWAIVLNDMSSGSCQNQYYRARDIGSVRDGHYHVVERFYVRRCINRSGLF
jgi:hypothetical protein